MRVFAFLPRETVRFFLTARTPADANT